LPILGLRKNHPLWLFQMEDAMDQSTSTNFADETARQSRNQLWLSPELGATVRESPLVVVGCGGNGMLFVINAAHIGFRHFTLCDPDTLNATNLNRLPPAVPAQVGQPKVEIARSYLAERFPQAVVDCSAEPFPNTHTAEAFSSAAFVIAALDTIHIRLEVDVLARKYRRVLLDLGSGFALDDRTGLPYSAGGQILVSRPAGPCLMCLGFDSWTARNTYFVPAAVDPEPSSLLLNNVVATLAIEVLLRELSNRSQAANRITYDRETLSITLATLVGLPTCHVCGEHSIRNVESVTRGEELVKRLTKEGVVCKTA
jgi:hypothetical protein